MFGKTKVAIMGTGNIAEVMARTLKKMRGVNCYAVGSRSQDRADTFARTHGIKKAYGSYLELVCDPKVDLIYIATPHSEHFANVKLAIEHGKAVLCEKAFMLNEKQARQIFQFAEEKKVFVSEAMWTRFLPFNDTIRQVIAGGTIGEPMMLSANLGYNIAGKQRIMDPSLGGGALLDIGVYPLNFASMVFGDDVTDIASIGTLNPGGVDEQDSITLRYRNGRMAVLNCTTRAVGDRTGMICGTRGCMVLNNINNYESLTVYDNTGKKMGFYKRPRQITGYEYEVRACIRAMKKGFLECPEMPHAETLKMLNMMDFIRHQLNVVYPCEMPIVQTVQESVKAAEQPAVESTVDNIAGSAVEDTIENAVENTADHGSEEE
jgi:predicted dehydrogenase